MKKIIPIMIALAMLTVCFVAFDTDVDAAVDNGLWIGEHEITGDDSGTGWSYVASTNTLTLSGDTTFSSKHTDTSGFSFNATYRSGAIYDGRTGTLNIVLTGNNTISGLGPMVDGYSTNGIFIKDSVTISGSGSLTIAGPCTNAILVGKDFTMSGGNITIQGDMDLFGIWAIGEGGSPSFTVSGGHLSLMNASDVDSNGPISISGGIIDTTGGILSATSSTFTLTSGIVRNTSIEADYVFLRADNGFTITGGTGALTNLSPKDSGTPCDLADANMLVSIAAGAASVGSAPATYTVSFDKNGGSGTMADVTGVSGSYTLPASTFTAPAGKEFKCWSVADVEKNVGDSITVTANTTVKAIWQTTGTGYTVTFDANGGTGTMDKKTGVSGEYTLPESTFTAPDGKEFKCWKVGDDEKNAGDKITVSSDITVKAVWKDKSSGGNNNIGLIIGGVIAGIVVVGAVAFFLIKRP